MQKFLMPDVKQLVIAFASQVLPMLRKSGTNTFLDAEMRDTSKISESDADNDDSDDDDDDDEGDELGDEFIVTDPARATVVGSSAAAKLTPTDEVEQARRAELVKELLLEEGPNKLERYEVKGSEKSWNAAIAGHGSELASLHIRIPQDEKTKSG